MPGNYVAGPENIPANHAIEWVRAALVLKNKKTLFSGIK
jgi:hypothetical protein